MKIETTRFGQVEIGEEFVFEFIDPILGYEDNRRFVLIEHNDASDFKWLQSVDVPELAFVVTIAGLFGIDYSFTLPDAVQEKLEITSADDILSLSVVVIPHENPRKSTINLLAPLIINLKNNKASQVILSGSNLPVDYPLFDRGE